MSTAPRLSDLARGEVVGTRTVTFTRADLVAYAGASGDRNPIHWSPTFAEHVGLPGVIAHGMLTMAEAARVVTDWAGDPARVESYGVRFSRPVVVPDDDAGATVVVTGTVEEKLDGGRVKVTLSASVGEQKVLSRASAVVRLDP